jgi:hypothetical protein
MNKAQKITLVCTLFIMFVTLIYPPIAMMNPYEGHTALFPSGRSFLFSFIVKPDKKWSEEQINTKKLIVELLAIGFLGGTFFVLFSLKKKKN